MDCDRAAGDIVVYEVVGRHHEPPGIAGVRLCLPLRLSHRLYGSESESDSKVCDALIELGASNQLSGTWLIEAQKRQLTFCVD